MSALTKCDLCNKTFEGIFPKDWLIFYTKPASTGNRLENDLCPKCKAKIPKPLLDRLEKQNKESKK